MKRSKGRRFKEPFGKAGLIVAICALAMAMVGGAYAAGALSGRQKKEVTKIAKKLAGKPGANGANGANGSPGAQGAAGAAGKAGTNGTDGTSVTSAPASGGECPAGGTNFTSASGTEHVCNGEDGTTGFTETLPAGKTEKGSWALRTDGETGGVASISFSIPLEVGLDSSHVFYLYPPGVHAQLCTGFTGEEKEECEEAVEAEEEVEENNCLGTAGFPEAKPGDLCVYGAHTNEGVLTPVSSSNGVSPGLPIQAPVNEELLANPGASASGAVLILGSSSEGTQLGWGTWAVTAPEP